MNEINVQVSSYSYSDFLKDCEIFSERTRGMENFKWDLHEVNINTNSSFVLNMVIFFL
jgi:hypothetical protein